MSHFLIRTSEDFLSAAFIANCNLLGKSGALPNNGWGPPFPITGGDPGCKLHLPDLEKFALQTQRIINRFQ